MEAAHPLGTADEIIRSYYKLVHHVAKRFRWALSPSLQYDDLVSEGMAGLLKAYKNFDESKGFKFTTFAMPMIQWEIQRHLRDREQVMSVPRSVYDLAGKISQQQLSDMKPSEIAMILSCDEKKAEEALNYLELKISSIDQALPGQDNDQRTVQDIIPVTDDLSEVLTQDFLDSLTARERQLVQLRLAGSVQKEIGRVLSLSQVQISRLQAKIGEKLKLYMEGEIVESSGLTKEKYLELKGQNKTDFEIRTMFGASEAKFTRLKKEWGIAGMRRVINHKKSKATNSTAKQPTVPASIIHPPAAPDPEIRWQQLQDELHQNNQLLERFKRENELLRALLKNYL